MPNSRHSGLPITRRSLFAAIAAGSSIAMLGKAAFASPLSRKPVVGFHADAPWLDPAGLDLPYRPATAGRRSVPDTESLARLGHFL